MSEVSEGASVADLVELLKSSGGALRNYDKRLDVFYQSGALAAAVKDGQVVRTPIDFQLADPSRRPDPVVSVLLGVVAALVFLIIAGESLNWWNLFPENRRRGDWHSRSLDASREPFDPPQSPPTP